MKRFNRNSGFIDKIPYSDTNHIILQHLIDYEKKCL
jgi:hypothetical protein